MERPSGERQPARGSYPSFRSHLIPRTRDGRVGLLVFAILFALVEPPLLYRFANRIHPVFSGIPFLYLYLTSIYAGLAVVLLWVRRRGV